MILLLCQEYDRIYCNRDPANKLYDSITNNEVD